MDFLEVNKQVKKNELMKIEAGGITVDEATQSLMEQINIEPLIEKAVGFKITCDTDAQQALSMGMQARKLKKTLEESRMRIVRPHLDFQRAINSIVKEYTKKLESIETNLKGRLETWLEAQAPFENNYADMIVEVEDGKLTQKKTWDFEIEDISQVPEEYLAIDERKVKEKIKKGIRSIPGLKIFEKNQINMRIKND